MPDIRIEHITFSYDSILIVDDVSFTIPSGSFFSLIGPNGAGKTTLLKLVSYLHSPSKGEIFINDKATWQYSRIDLAKLIAVVPQKETNVFPFSVQEVVLMGRSPHLRGIGFESKRDKEIARRAMTMTDIVHLALRPVTELSGGEQHRVSIARALAQQTPILLLDEPNAHLDIQHQIALFDLLKMLNQEKGTTILCVSHDINLASQYSDRIALLSQGKVIAIGTPREVVTEIHIQEAFHVPVEIDIPHNTSAPRLSLKPGGDKKEFSSLAQPVPIELASVHHHQEHSLRIRLIHRILSVSILVEIFGWIYLTFIRYDNQGLTLSSFDLFKTSNLVSIFLGSILLGSMFLHYRKTGHLEIHFAKMLLTMSLLSVGFLLWNFYPEISVKFISATGYILLKTYQVSYSVLRHVNRVMRTSIHTVKSIGLSAIFIVMVLASTSTFIWLSQNKPINSIEGLKADVVIFFPTFNNEIQRSLPLMTTRDIAAKMFSTSMVKKFFVVEGNTSSLYVPSSRLYNDVINAGVPANAIQKVDDETAQNHIINFIAQDIRKSRMITIVAFCDQFQMKRFQEMFSFHSLPVTMIPLEQSWSVSQILFQRIRESVLLFFFWIFGM